MQFFSRISWLPQSFILQVLNVWPQCCRKRPNSRRWAMRRHVVGQTRGALSKHSINYKSLHISTESLQNLYGILVNLYDIRFLVSNMSIAFKTYTDKKNKNVNTNFVLASPWPFWGCTLYRYPICDTSRSTEILTTDRGRPSFVHGIKFKNSFCPLLICWSPSFRTWYFLGFMDPWSWVCVVFIGGSIAMR